MRRKAAPGRSGPPSPPPSSCAGTRGRAGTCGRSTARHRPERNQAAGGGPQHHRHPYAQAEAEVRHTPRPRADRKGGRAKPHPPHVTAPIRPALPRSRGAAPPPQPLGGGGAGRGSAVPSGRCALCPHGCALLSARADGIAAPHRLGCPLFPLSYCTPLPSGTSHCSVHPLC